MSSKKTIDWEAIERDYRVGQLSLRALATKHGTTAGAISKKASAGNWVKDASQEVRERTRAALLTEPRKEKAREELGDLLFVVANLARKLEVEPEDALRAANAKFIRRFGFIETELARDGRTPEQSYLAEMDALWDAAKAAEKN